MIFTVSLVVLLLSITQAASSSEEIPFVVASKTESDDAKLDNLIPEREKPDIPPPLTLSQSPSNRGRSDIEIENDQPEPSGGYVYPKPLKSFNLPEFKTLDANAPLDQSASLVEIEKTGRNLRSSEIQYERPAPSPFVPEYMFSAKVRYPRFSYNIPPNF